MTFLVIAWPVLVFLALLAIANIIVNW